MQMAYQFPERCERLVLVSSGGLGREVNLMLRAAVLPGSELVLPLLASSRVLNASTAVGGFFAKLGMRAGPDLEEISGAASPRSTTWAPARRSSTRCAGSSTPAASA